MSETCQVPRCCGWAPNGLCTLHMLEKAEARVAELEKELALLRRAYEMAAVPSVCTDRTGGEK